MSGTYTPMTADLPLFKSASYFNTTSLPNPENVEASRDAAEQEARVLQYFRSVLRASPSQVWQDVYGNSNVPITSVRRAITTLTGKGLLCKTDDFVAGEYGRREHVWRLA